MNFVSFVSSPSPPLKPVSIRGSAPQTGAYTVPKKVFARITVGKRCNLTNKNIALRTNAFASVETGATLRRSLRLPASHHAFGCSIIKLNFLLTSVGVGVGIVWLIINLMTSCHKGLGRQSKRLPYNSKYI